MAATKTPIEMFRGTVKAPFGTLTVVASDKGVRFCMFAEDAHPKSFDGLIIRDDQKHPMVKKAIDQLREYFAGTRKKFDVKLDLQGTEFQVEAWRALAKVPYGKTASYAEQAASIGRPTAVRAIGGANGRNPIVVILPCHRIIGADGSLTGFGGGLPVKVWLLEHEQRMLSKRAV